MSKHNQNGFAVVEVIIIVVVVVAVGFVGWKLTTNRKGKMNDDKSSTETRDSNTISKGDCSKRLSMQMPVDLSKVTGILYPGQYRNPHPGPTDDYKSHGGFRFNDSYPDEITITAPMDGKVTAASRYIQAGEVQMYIDFNTDCQVMYRFDHIAKLTPKLEAIFKDFPAPTEDSRSTDIKTTIEVKAGEKIITAVGMKHSNFSPKGETFIDFGVWDLSTENTVAKTDSAWRAKHGTDPKAMHGICWLDLFTEASPAKVRAIPAASASGATSDYCE